MTTTMGAHGGAGTNVIEIGEAQFEQLMEASLDRLVVLDFWAEWCGPCKTLGPLLEQLAEDYDGAFLLAKVDVDKNPRLAQAFRAQSIPMVFAVFGGQMVDQFTGALPRPQIEAWLDAAFKRVGIEAKRKSAEQAPTDPAQAEQYWRQVLAKDPQAMNAKLKLGKLLFARGAVDEAEAQLASIPPAAKEYNAAQAALALKELIVEIGEAGGEGTVRERAAANPDDADAAYHVALAEGVGGRFAEALEVLVGQVQRGTPEQKERAKQRAQLLLSAAGRGDDAVEQQRRRLARLLF